MRNASTEPMFHDHTLVLGCAWILLLLSLAAPAFKGHSFFSTEGHLPVYMYVALGFISLLSGGGLAFPDILILGILCFLTTPLLVRLRPSNLVAHALLILTTAILLAAPWILLTLAFFIPSLSEINASVEWGYYLFAFAHTLASVACVMIPRGFASAKRNIGFQVIVREE